ncbi:hypothetical protein BDZ97DRAFT_723466 [Flammula alnicola]|nr:hypothetical protein BDZ97DRAFT_723466 [Flammula alnicola]
MSVSILDDRDPIIIYSSNTGWRQGGTTGEHRKTSMFTSEAGATAKITFNGGSSIGVFGTISAGGPPPQSAYSIDGGPAVTFIGNPPSTGFRFQQRYFQSKTLRTNDSHTLIITTLVHDATYSIDFIEIIAADSSATGNVGRFAPSASSPALTSTTTNQSSIPVLPQTSETLSPGTTESPFSQPSLNSSSTTSSLSLPSSSSLPSPSLPSSPDSKSTARLGAIEGGAVVGVVLILIIVFCLLNRRRRFFSSILQGWKGSRPFLLHV